ncbi:MAG TPA: DUF3108 domain-containing protein, partial [Anaeromyxobacteraceae bacterium]|nr:DUF3108 domain-containing protein [Anaeromyxobacteraceae bacterium]
PGEQIDLSVDWHGIHAGKVRMSVGQAEGAIWPIICQGGTDGLASVLDVREHYVAYWDAERRASRGTDVNAIEVGDRHFDQSRFDRESGKATVKITRKGRVTQSTHDVPADVHDLASALYFLRLQPLAPGARYAYPVFSGKDTFLLEAQVEGHERVETPAGAFDALRVRVRLGFQDRWKSKRDAQVWLTTDARRVPVRATADFALGSIDARLESYRPGGPMAASAR